MKSFAKALMAATVAAAPAAEKVDYLPQMETFDYGVYSGYLPINGTGKNYHYLFLESQRDPVNDPLVIWFNGGPGCSSLLGFAQELGPYAMDDGTDFFFKNDYSWNNFSNVLFLESPTGVGYSSCSTTDECTFNDDTSAEDNFQIILQWMTEKFPEFGGNDLYISGESYAGIYVPYVSRLIHNYNQNVTDDQFKFNFKGWMVGNGVTNWKYDGVSSYVEMGFFHGLYSTQLHDQLQECDLHYFDFRIEEISDHCINLVMQFINETEALYIYDIYLDTIFEDPMAHPNKLRMYDALKAKLDDGKAHKVPARLDYRYTPWMFRGLVDRHTPNEDSPLVKYFNLPEVREALHIPDSVGKWDMCNNTYNYSADVKGSIWVWEELHTAPENYRFLKYSGDVDGAVPTLGTEKWIAELGWDVLEKYRPYYLPNGEVGGYIEVRDGLTYASVHGAGHMVPQYKRPEAYYLIQNWLEGTPI